MFWRYKTSNESRVESCKTSKRLLTPKLPGNNETCMNWTATINIFSWRVNDVTCAMMDDVTSSYYISDKWRGDHDIAQ